LPYSTCVRTYVTVTTRDVGDITATTATADEPRPNTIRSEYETNTGSRWVAGYSLAYVLHVLTIIPPISPILHTVVESWELRTWSRPFLVPSSSSSIRIQIPKYLRFVKQRSDVHSDGTAQKRGIIHISYRIIPNLEVRRCNLRRKRNWRRQAPVAVVPCTAIWPFSVMERK